MNPLLGLAVGAGAGALGGALSDYGINDTFTKEVAEVLRPGQAALFMMVREHVSDSLFQWLALPPPLNVAGATRVRLVFRTLGFGITV